MAKTPASEETVYGLMPNGTFITLKQEWEKNFRLQNIGDFLAGNSGLWFAMAAIPIFVIILHLSVGLIAFRICDQGWTGTGELLYTLICPPLFRDWEDIGRQGAKPETDLHKCWKKSLKFISSFIIIMAVENLLLCVPMWILRQASLERAASMAARAFPLLPSEDASLTRIDIMLFSALALYSVILPPLQVFLALAYLKYGHAWSRILVKAVPVFPWDVVDGTEDAVSGGRPNEETRGGDMTEVYCYGPDDSGTGDSALEIQVEEAASDDDGSMNRQQSGQEDVQEEGKEEEKDANGFKN